VEGECARVDTSLLPVPVSVVESQWQVRRRPQRQDFRIFEEGVEQKIAYFATVESTLHVVLLLDTQRIHRISS